MFGTCSLLFVLVWLVRDRFSNLEHDQREKTNYFEEIQDISQNKDALSVWATRVMAAACSQPLPVLVTGASTQLKLSLAGSCVAKVREILLSLFAQVRVVLTGFGVMCSQDRTRRIFQFAQLWSQPKFNQQLSSTEFEVRLHSYPMIDFLLSLNLKMIMGKDQL